MSWFNYYGLIMVVLLLIPTIIATIKKPDTFTNHVQSRFLLISEQVARFGVMILLVFNIPYTWMGFYFNMASSIYLIVNGVLLLAYLLIWLIMWHQPTIVRAILLSVIPALLFLFSGIMIVSLPLIIFAIAFMIAHVWVSVKNTYLANRGALAKKPIWLTVGGLLGGIILLTIGVMAGTICYQLGQLKKLDSMTPQTMIEYDVSNSDTIISVGIIENGNITYYTYNQNGEIGGLYDYEIGSLSKTFLGLMFNKLISNGTVKLSDSIDLYLELEDNKYYPTIERLLTHTSGYDNYYLSSEMVKNRFSPDISNDFYGISKETLLTKIQKIDLVDQDYEFCYSNFGIAVLGLVLEAIYDTDYVTLMNDFLTSEIGLTNTKVAKTTGNLSDYWSWKSDDAYLPAGAIISNIADMTDYLNYYLQNWGTVGSACSPLKTITSTNATYEQLGIRMDAIGMTWISDTENDFIWHNGATSNYNSYMAFNYEKQVGVVLLGNFNADERITLTVIGAQMMKDLLAE